MITVTIVGGEEAVERFSRMPGRLRTELAQGIGRAVLKLQAYVKDAKLSDEVLQVRTGRLRRSITQRIEQDGDSVTGIVGTNVEYARVHEYGFQGQVTVREYLRRAKDGPRAVRSHQRSMNLPERSFLRSALEEMRPEIREEIQRALLSALGAL